MLFLERKALKMTTTGGKGYKAQNNTQSIITDPDSISRFQSELIAEHMAARVKKTGNAVEGAERKGKK